MKDFKKLKVWQKGMEIVKKTYQLARMLPEEERFGLRSQMTRSAVSIPSNIAEGSGKSGKKDYKNYLEMALASTYELETQTLIVEMLECGSPELVKGLLSDIDEEEKMLIAFTKTVNS